MNKKYCGRCKQTKPLSAFGKCKTFKDGLSFYCKECNRQDAKRLREANLERYRRYNREYQQRRISGKNWTPRRFYRIRTNARRRQIPFGMTLKDFIKWFENQPQICHYCQCPLTSGNGSSEYSSLNVDRKDNHKGYFLDNLVLACRRCNSMKGDWLTYEQTMEIAKKYFTHSEMGG